MHEDEGLRHGHFFLDYQKLINMKKIFLLLSIALLSLNMAFASGVSIASKGDTMTVVEDGDTTRIVGSVGKIINGITSALNDTVLGKAVSEDELSDESASEMEELREMNWNKDWQRTQLMVENIITYITWGCVAICFISLLFYYLHRKAKYRMMEKAIENNYPLPGSPLASPPDQRPAAPQQPPIDATLNTQPFPPSGQPLPAGTPIDFNSIKNQLNWNAFNKSIVLIATGIGGMLFFFTAGSPEVSMLMSIVLLIGLAKAFTTYQSQKQWIAQQRCQTQAAATSQQSENQQPTPPTQPPVFNKGNDAQER